MQPEQPNGVATGENKQPPSAPTEAQQPNGSIPAETQAGTVPGEQKTTLPQEPQMVVPVDLREMTKISTDKGEIHVIHEITFGDLLVSTILAALLLLILVTRFIGGVKRV